MTEESSKLRMNLVAIQKVDPYAKEILDSSPHVAFYKFIEGEWSKTEIEGSFFVYSRVAEPFNSIFINNRLNTNSLVEPITRQIELQQQSPFLLYRNERSAISGFWFYCKDDCVRVHELLEKLIKKCNNARPAENNNLQNHGVVQQPQQVFMMNQNGNGANVDIFSMLSKAQEDFNNAGVTERSNAPPHQLNQKFIGMQLNNAPPQPQQQQNHQPLMKQLSNAMPDITSPNVVNFFAAAQQPNSESGQSQKKQFSVANPPVQTVDEIEKQHRVSQSPPQPKIEQKSNFNHLLHSVTQQQQQSILPQTQPIIKLQQPGSFYPSNKPALITPAMFQVSKMEEKVIIVPSMAVQSNVRPEPLTQNQLVQALNYLMETDPEFIRKVHEAYVKSFNKVVSL